MTRLQKRSAGGYRYVFSAVAGFEKLLDRIVIPATRIILFLIGLTFIVLLWLAVIGRHGFSLPLAVIEDTARILLIWFFMLGMGLAFHNRAHVAFTLLVENLPLRLQYHVTLLGHLIGIVFVLHVIAGGLIGLGAANEQVEPTLNIGGLWSAAAVPLGAVVLLLHQFRAFLSELMGAGPSSTSC